MALTNGNEYRLYNSHATVPVEQKLFRTVRISDPTTRPAETLSLLSKVQLQDQLIDRYWRSEVVDRQVGEALKGLFPGEPDPSIVRLVHGRAPTLARADVKASLGRLRATFDVPLVPVSAPTSLPPPALASPSKVAASSNKTTAPPSKAVGERTPWRHVTLAQLVDAGRVTPPLEIFHRYKGVDLRATIEGGDRVVYAGVVYDSVSTAGGMARKSVVGDKPGRPYPQTNGWTFWEYRVAEGSRRQLDTLRSELFAHKVVPIKDGLKTG